MIFKILVFDNLKIAKNECFRKIVIVTVSAKIYNWTFSMIIWHYSAICTANFKWISLFFTDLEQFSWGPFFFFDHLVFIFCKIFISNKMLNFICKSMTIIYNTCPDFEKKIFLEEFTIYFYFLGMQFLFCQLQKKRIREKT